MSYHQSDKVHDTAGDLLTLITQFDNGDWIAWDPEAGWSVCIAESQFTLAQSAGSPPF